MTLPFYRLYFESWRDQSSPRLPRGGTSLFLLFLAAAAVADAAAGGGHATLVHGAAGLGRGGVAVGHGLAPSRAGSSKLHPTGK